MNAAANKQRGQSQGGADRADLRVFRQPDAANAAIRRGQWPGHHAASRSTTRPGQLSPLGETRGIDDTGWLVLDPRRRVLYTTCEQSGHRPERRRGLRGVDPPRADLTLLNIQPTLGGESCHASLSIDGRFLLRRQLQWRNAGRLAGGLRSRLSRSPPTASLGSGRQQRPASMDSGPNPSRQTTAHAHCVVPSPDGRLVYVADLGIDRIVVYALGADGSLTPQPGSDFAVPPGLGPRHLVFNPDGRSLFMVSELIATVMSFSVDPQTGALTERHAFPIPTLGDTIVQPAGIVLSAERPRHLFVALRVCNEILGLAVDPQTGRLTPDRTLAERRRDAARSHPVAIRPASACCQPGYRHAHRVRGRPAAARCRAPIAATAGRHADGDQDRGVLTLTP